MRLCEGTGSLDHGTRSSAAMATSSPGAIEGVLDDATRALTVPLASRLVEQCSVGAASAGIAVAVILVGVVLLREALLGRLAVALADPTGSWVYLSIVDALLVGYLVAARVSIARAGRATLDALGDVLELPALRREQLRSQMGSYRRARLLAAGSAGAMLGVLAPLVIRGGAIDPWTMPGAWAPEAVSRRILAPVVGWMFGTYVLVTIREARRVSGLARHLASIDLFDRDMVAPFSRFGLQLAFRSAGLVSVIALMVTERGLGHVVALLVGVAAAAAAAGLLLPLRGLRERICAEKRRELVCCRDALRRARDAMVEGRSVVTEHGRLSEVVAYKQLVEGVEEWPIDMPTVLRAGGYVVLPVVSWFSGSVAPDAIVRIVAMVVG